MKGVCFNCGVVALLSQFAQGATDKMTMAIIAKLPREVALLSLDYLALFRSSSGRSISSARAHKLLVEFDALVALRSVQIPGKVARPCPPGIWAQAIEQMLAGRDGLELPMANHNYLRKVAYGMADKADAAREKVRNEGERIGESVTRRRGGAEIDKAEAGPVDIKKHLEELKKRNPNFR